MKVLKFGGSSIASPEGIDQVKKIIGNEEIPLIVVVSAFKNVTDKLEETALQASLNNNEYKNALAELTETHQAMCSKLVPENQATEVLHRVNEMLGELCNILDGVFLLNDLTTKTRDKILSFGELLSATIIASLFPNARLLDARDIIKTNAEFGSAMVNYEQTNPNIRKAFASFGGVSIVPGFVGSTSNNQTTTLGRGGSDYTAAIFAAALEASSLEIWTDVNGFMTADPQKVKKALAIDSLSYAEAMELSHFGAQVVYTPTIHPALQKKIPIYIKNTFSPEISGTKIIESPEIVPGNSPIKGVSSIDDVDLITLQGAGMVGVKGISSRLFGALAQAGVNVILITQASSEYSITFAIAPSDTSKAIAAIESAFEAELDIRNEIKILVEKDLSIIAIVGEQMKNTPGISATLFKSLGRNGISAIATAQGSSELNISVVIRRDSLKKALNVIHEGFFLSHNKEIHLFMVGVGTVGSSLLKQIKQQKAHLLEAHNVNVNVVGLCRSRKMLVNAEGIDLDNYLTAVDEGEPTDLNKFVQYISKLNLRNSVFVDCTADDGVSSVYMDVLNSFASVVTANKVACSSEFELYRDLKKTALKNNVKFMYETNVGAGLPIITTINDLSKSGDKVLKLEAVLSGTLNFLFNALSENVTLSQAIKQAKELGFSEPDPRIDLSGIDVVRKLIILAREAGYPLEQKDIQIESFIPQECFEGSLDEFWVKVAKYDDEFETKRKELVEKGLKWRFIASLDNGIGKVSLQTVDMLHPAYPLEGSNNILLLTTERYNEAPMVIRGYGAGADVTAAGVFADIIRVVNV